MRNTVSSPFCAVAGILAFLAGMPASAEDEGASDAGKYYTVPVLAQPTDTTCWATSVAMLAQVGGGYAEGEAPTPEQVVDAHPSYASGLPVQAGGMVNAGPFREVLSSFDMQAAPLRKYSAEEVLTLLQDKGPLIFIYSLGTPFSGLVSKQPPPSHVVVLTGMYVANNDWANAELTINDPWKPAQERKIQWKDFQKKLDELAKRVNSGYFIGHLKSKPENL